MPCNPVGPRARHAGQHIIEIDPGKVFVAQSLDDATALRDIAFWKSDNIEEVNSGVFIQGCKILSQLFIGCGAWRCLIGQFGPRKSGARISKNHSE